MIDFTKHELKDSLKEVRNQLARCLQDTSHSLISTTAYEKENKNLGSEKSKAHFPEAWSEGKVKEWFSKNSMSINILEHLAPCSGIILKQIYDIKKAAPEFYYQSLKEINGVNLNTISIFTHFLVKKF